MSSIIEFFVAPDDEAAAGVLRDGPGNRFESAAFGNFDAWSSLEEWESILLGRDLDDVLERGGPEVLAGTDGPLVARVGDDLTRALAEADSATLSDLAERWLELRADEGEEIDEELADDLLGEVAALAAKGSLYCWIS